MKNFGRALEARGCAWLLISGQAAVVYGASTFSEDFDIWVRPTAKDLKAMLLALRDIGATMHKLTPPLELEFLKAGHGFHFRLPADSAGDLYLDVMGRPPRVGAFGPAFARSESVVTPWGRMAVCSIEDLVEIKKTRRPRDYDVITSLARVRLDRALAARTSQNALRKVVRWALDNTFGADEMVSIFERAPDALDAAARARRPSVRTLAAAWRESPREPSPDVEDRLIAQIAEEQGALQRKDAKYWHPIIHELRELRRAGRLLEEGSKV